MKFRLKDLREDHDYTQTQVANHLGIPQTTYSGYERRSRAIPLEVLCQLADFYNTSVDYILGRTDDPAPPLFPLGCAKINTR